MTPSDSDGRQEALAGVLKETWNLFDEVRQYIDPEASRESDLPDFAAIAQRMVPDPSREENRRFDRASMQTLVEMIEACRLCTLGSTRDRAVPGEGPANARLMVVGEGPGADEDRTGRPFVGKAGQYLDSWLGALGLHRADSVYIANIVKCRPPDNRDPRLEEAQACLPYLKRQIALVKPDCILCVGKVAARFLLGQEDALHALRTKVHRFEGIPVVITYHPAAVLRNLQLRSPVWEDLKRVAALLGLPVSQGRR